MSGEIEPTQLLIPLWHVARALGWSTELTRDRFIRAHLAIKPPGASEWSVLRAKLLAEMPIVVERIDEMVSGGELQKVRLTRGKKISITNAEKRSHTLTKCVTRGIRNT